MEFFSNIVSNLGNIDFETIAQLTALALIVIAGPAVIFVLAAARGNL